MPNQRILLWVALVSILYLNYLAWQKDYGAKPPTAIESQAPQASAPKGLGDTVPTAPTSSAPSSSTPEATIPSSPQASVPSPQQSVAPAEGQTTTGEPTTEQVSSAEPGRVHVVTDVLDMDINLKGGTFERADLLQYPLHKDQAARVRLFNAGEPVYLLQSGLTSTSGEQPNHLAVFSSPAKEFRLAAGANELRVPLTWTDGQGVTVTKTFTFQRGGYRAAVDYRIRNDSSAPYRAASYVQLIKQEIEHKRSMFDVESYAFTGPAVWDGTKYRKLDLTDEDDQSLQFTTANGWLAGLQHHFVAAAIPAKDQSYAYRLQVNGLQFLLSAVGPTQTVAPGAAATISETLFIGPKLQKQLQALHPELDRTADYGMLYPLAKPLFVLLEWVHRGVGNWGWTIIIVTFLLKLVFYPLSEASGRSMAKMRALAPRIKNIQERYKDDKEQLGRQTMELYKREKINPLAGCLPILIQIPVFLAFYWVLLESVEMRQAPYMLWINDLSSKDPFFVLPILMGVAMFGQYKLNPAPPDPIQAKVFMFMPVIMTVMFAWFPAGLVLYWLTNTLLSIAQQWRINKVIEAKLKKQKTTE